MKSFRVSQNKITAILSLLLILALGVTLNVTPTAQANVVQPIQVPSSPNPAWPNKCGIKLGLLVDRSNSISTSEGTQLKTAANGFVDALAGTPSQIAVAQFRKTASQTLGFTSVTNPAGATTVKNAINGYVFGTSDNDGSTNWDAAFQSQKNLGADVIVILTDGNPTSRNIDGSGGNGSSDPLGYNLDAGITSANEVKANGARIVAVGIGNDVDTGNLQAISGPVNNSDYFTSSFETLNTKLLEIAQTLCGGTVTVQKLVKNLDGSYTPTDGWAYNATNAVTPNKSTSNGGTAEFKFENAPKNTVITETLKPGYALESIECKKNGQTIGSVSGLSVSLTVNTNDIISCTFKNQPTQGSVTVTKLIKNTDGTYSPANNWDYTATGAIDTTSSTTGNGTAVFAYVNTPKSTTITETVKTGYSIESVECRNVNNQVIVTSTSSSVTFDVPTNDSIGCTFKNVRDTGSLRVVKNASGGNGTFSFSSDTALGNFDLTTVGGTAQTSVVSVPTGTYDITESVPAGWSLDSASCTGATPSVVGSKVTVAVAKNVNVVCTFNNSRDTASLRVVKNATGGNSTFSFTSDTSLGNFDLTTVGGTAQTNAVSINTGSYEITESSKTGWTLDSASCTGATFVKDGSKLTITATKNAQIVCTFNNSRDTASLRVVKNATGGNGTFSFTSDTSLGNFDLTTVGGTAQTNTVSINTGTYEITESGVTGWSLDSASCSGTTFVKDGSKLSITATKGANIICTFGNSRDTGTLTVRKVATGGNGTFSFTSNTAFGNFDLTTVGGTAQTSTISVPTGTYNLAETVPTGWTLDSSSCEITNFQLNPGFIQPSTFINGVTIAKGQDVVCTFNNSRDTASLRVVKNATGGNGTFSFTSDTSLGNFDLTTVGGTAQTDVVSIDTGSYEISESVLTDWSLTGLSCTNTTTTIVGSKVTINVTKGASIVCTFNNSRDTASLRVVKNATGGNGTFSFTSDTSLGNFDLTTVGGTAQTDVVSIDTGTYEITESGTTGWTLDSASCSGAAFVKDGSKLSITAIKGANIVCTFGNVRDTGSLRVVKNASGGNGMFSFSSDTALGDFDLTTVGGTAQTSVVSVPTGTYDITESVPAGWSLDSASCTGATPSVVGSKVTVAVAKNVNVVCTFNNSRDTASLRVVKNATGGNSTFSFTSDTSLGNFDLTTVGGTAQTNAVSINTGSYEITESSKTGWTLDSASCTGATFVKDGSKLTITATKDAEIICTFENSRDTGSLTIQKFAVGDDSTFSFESNTPLGNFELETNFGIASTSVSSIDTGEYVISEIVPSDWELTNISCENAQFSVVGESVTVSVEKDAEVVCAFTNSRDKATLKVVVIANGGDETFPFETDTPFGDFDLTTIGGEASTDTITLNTGSYNLAELVPTGWTLNSVSCELVEEEEAIEDLPIEVAATIEEVVNPLAIELAVGDQLVCTFVNDKDPVVQGTTVTRVEAPVAVKGVSTQRLAATGSQTSNLTTSSIVILLVGLASVFLARKRRGLLG